MRRYIYDKVQRWVKILLTLYLFILLPFVGYAQQVITVEQGNAKSLLDAINLTESNRLDGIEQFIQALMVFGQTIAYLQALLPARNIQLLAPLLLQFAVTIAMGILFRQKLAMQLVRL